MSPLFLVVGLVFTAAGALFRQRAMARAHSALRATLGSSPVRYEEANVKARCMAGQSLFFAWGDLTVHDRIAVLYQHNLVALAPIVLVPSKGSSASHPSSVVEVVLTSEPWVDGDSVELVGKEGTQAWTLRITTEHPAELADALRAMFQRSPEPFR